MHDVPSSTRTPPVDNTDWLKTVAIVAVAIGHFGHFFMENDHWWAVFGRVAAPAFFFLQGYAGEPDDSAQLDMDRCYPDFAR